MKDKVLMVVCFILIIVEGVLIMNHEKVYVVCENMCMEEGLTKQQIEDEFNGKSNVGHNHNDIYYTESEMDTKLNGYKPKGEFVTLTGSMTISAGSKSKTSDNIAYPNGFTPQNSVVFSAEYLTSGSGYGSYTSGIAISVLNRWTNDGANNFCNVQLNFDSPVQQNTTYNFRVVLMKIQ